MFRFTIRDLLWLTVVVAVALAVWSMERRRSSSMRRDYQALVGKHRKLVVEHREFEKVAWIAGIEIKKVGKDSWSSTYKQPGAKWNKYFPKTAFEIEGLLPPKD